MDISSSQGTNAYTTTPNVKSVVEPTPVQNQTTEAPDAKNVERTESTREAFQVSISKDAMEKLATQNAASAEAAETADDVSAAKALESARVTNDIDTLATETPDAPRAHEEGNIVNIVA
jgi:hypothetical protein